MQLRDLGIDPDGPERLRRLRSLERQDLGAQIAARTGQTFVPWAPDGFRGRVEITQTPIGVSYAIVSDGQQFAILPTSATLGATAGKVVVLARDARGRTYVQAPALDRKR